MRDLALDVPRLVVLEPPGVALEQQRRRAGALDLLGDRQLARQQVARQPVLLAVQHHARAGLEDVGALAEQPRVLEHLRAPAPGHQHDLHARAQARLHGAHAVDRHRSLAVVQQRGAAAEQRAVEVEVQAADAHATLRLANGGGRSTERLDAGRVPAAPTASPPQPAARRPSRQPAGDRGQHRERHRRERRQRLVAVAVLLEVDLGDPLEPDLAPDVDQHRDLHAVAGGEREPLEQLAARGDLARQRLADARELRVEQLERRTRHQVVDAPAAVRQVALSRPLGPRHATRTAGGRRP